MRRTTHFKYKMEDVECKFCTEYNKRQGGCTRKICPWLAERIEAGVVGYEEALLDSFPHDYDMDAKLRTGNNGQSLHHARQSRHERKRLTGPLFCCANAGVL